MNPNETMQSIAGPAGPLAVVTRAGSPGGRWAGRGLAAVICHPHPLYGGDMDNKVVTTLARAYADFGIPASRFNFRGVGASAGVHDHGRGEVDDVVAVARWAAGAHPDGAVLLAGFSFGAAMAAAACDRVNPVHLTLVAPPLGRYAFAEDGGFPCPVCVLSGDADDLVDAGEVQSWAAALRSPATAVLIPGASHFFHGHLPELQAALTAALGAALA